MIKRNIIASISLLVLLGSCGNTSQKVEEEEELAIDNEVSTEFVEDIEDTDTVYLGKESLDAGEEEDNTTMVTRAFNVGRFSSIEGSGRLEIDFIESEKNSVEANGTSKQLENLVCEIKSGILKIYMKPSETSNDNEAVALGDGDAVVDNSVVISGGNVVINNRRVYNSGNNNGNTVTTGESTPIRIVVKGKLSDKLKTSASCRFTAESISTPGQLEIDLSSSSRVSIGKVACQDLDIDGSSASSLQISSVTAKDVDVSASSAASITMNVECDDIEIEASSASTCNISGKAKTIEKEASSAATINTSGLKKS